MSTVTSEFLDAAVAGDQAAFAQLVAPHRQAVHVHCYRMLGSFHDAEEAAQETLVRAWSALSQYDGRAPFGHWLYRIATNTCLMMIRTSGRRPRIVADVSHLEPYPDVMLDALDGASVDPAREIERRESVTLAFITALQLLPATQRAALILKDVLAFSSAEVADVLDTTVPSVNSSLQRARRRIGKACDAPATPHKLNDSDRVVLARFIKAWNVRDVDALTRLLAEDATLRMPPQPILLQGPRQIVDFLTTVPADGRLDLIQLVPTRSNGRSALAAYVPESDGQVPVGYGVMVFDISCDAITGITGFNVPSLIQSFGLPREFRPT